MQDADNPTKFDKHNTNMDVSHLRSLLVFGVEDLPSKLPISKLFHARFKLLKVLDLQGAKVTELQQISINLVDLRGASINPQPLQPKIKIKSNTPQISFSIFSIPLTVLFRLIGLRIYL